LEQRFATISSTVNESRRYCQRRRREVGSIDYLKIHATKFTLHRRHISGALLFRRIDGGLSPRSLSVKILGDLEYGSPLKPVSFKHWYPEAGMPMAQYDKAMERWDKMLREIGRK
jgi:hypothetical protein